MSGNSNQSNQKSSSQSSNHNNSSVELPILKPQISGQQSKVLVSKWIEKWHEVALKEFGIAAKCIEKGEKFQPPRTPPIPIPAGATAEEKNLIKSENQAQITDWIKRCSDQEMVLPKIFGMGWDRISQESREIIEAYQPPLLDATGNIQRDASGNIITDPNDWTNANMTGTWDRMDPIRLAHRCKATHSAANTHIPILDLHNAKKLYEQCKQETSESLLAFKTRFVERRDGVKTAGGAIEPPAEQAVRFLDALNSKYDKFFVDLQNQVRETMRTLPADVHEAWQSAEHYIEVPSASASTGSALAISNAPASEKSGKGKKKGKGKGKGKPSQSSGEGQGKTSESKSSGSAKGNPPTTPCRFCLGRYGDKRYHWHQDCEIYKEASADFPKSKTKSGSTHLVFSTGAVDRDGTVLCTRQVGEAIPLQPGSDGVCQGHVALKLGDGLGNTVVALDNQSTTNIFGNCSLLRNLRKAAYPIRITGISKDGKSVYSDQVGDWRDFRGIYYSDQAAANVLQFGDESHGCVNDFIKSEQTFVAEFPHFTYRFPRNEYGTYVLDTVNLPPFQERQVLVGTVAENLQQFTARQQKQMSLVPKLMEAAGFPSEASLIDLVSGGGLLNCPLTSQDVARARSVYGPSVPKLKGASTFKPSPVYRDEKPLGPRTVPAEVELDVDIFFVNQLAYVLSLGSQVTLTMVNELGKSKGARSIASILTAISKQLSRWQSRGFKVTKILVDPEAGLLAMKPALGAKGILVEPRASGTHVPTAERKIRVIKERCRSIIHSLPFTLPLFLMAWMVYFAVSRINLFPSRGGLVKVSPFEAFNGRKVDFDRDLRVGFGKYCEVNVDTTNTLKARTASAISLLPTGSASGSVKFFNLATGKIITRDRFTELPMPDLIINHMNALATKSGSLTADTLQFTVGAHELTDEETPDDFPAYFPDEVINIDDPHLDPILPVSSAGTTTGQPSTIGVPQFVVDAPPMPEYVPQPEAEPAALVQEPRSSQSGDLPLDSSSISPPDNPTNELPVPPSEPAPPAPSDPSDDQPALPEAEFIPPPRYGLRSSSRGGPRVHWDPRSGAPIPVTPEARRAAEVLLSRRSAARHHYSLHLTVKKALSQMTKKAIQSMHKELFQLHDKGVWTPQRPTFKHQKKVIKSFMFLKEKFSSDGSFEKLKSRLVAGGHMQDRGLAMFEDISSPTAQLPFIFMIAAIAAKERRHTRVIDIAGAYLNANISRHEILMELDPVMVDILVDIDPTYSEFVRDNGTMVVKLEKALYGCIESAKLWYDLLSASLQSIGYIKNPIDPCIFNKDYRGSQCTVAVYVDDLMVTCKEPAAIKELEDFLRDKFQEITVKEGPVLSYLGMTWDFTTAGEVKVTMEGYTADLLKDSGVKGVSATPATDNLFNVRDTSEPLDPESREEFHSLVAKILYMAKRTRPDVLLPIAFLTTRVQAPDVDDQSKLQRVVKYLNGTRELGIVLRPNDDNGIFAHIDASYGVHKDGKSHSGMFVTLGGGPLLTKSGKQKIVTKSSTEAEMVALSDLCSSVIWSRDFLVAQGMDPPPATVYQDNQSTMALIGKGQSTSERTRHINVRYYWVKDRVDSGDIQIVYLPTEDMVADIFTKPMQGQKFLNLRSMLLNWRF